MTDTERDDAAKTADENGAAAESRELAPAGEGSQEIAAPAESPESYSARMVSLMEQIARDPSVDVAKMQAVMDMQQKMQDREAEAAFKRAMVEAQTEMEPVTKDARNDTTKSKFARLEQIDRIIRPIYTRHGFSIGFTENDADEGMIDLTVIVDHNAGHTRNYRVRMPADTVGIKDNRNKTDTHGHASGLTYGRRYGKMLVFDLAFVDEDDDGNAAGRKAKPRQQGGANTTEQVEQKILDIWKKKIGACKDEKALNALGGQIANARMTEPTRMEIRKVWQSKRNELRNREIDGTSQQTQAKAAPKNAQQTERPQTVHCSDCGMEFPEGLIPKDAMIVDGKVSCPSPEECGIESGSDANAGS